MDLRLHNINYALDGGNWLTSFRNCVILWWPLDRMMSGLRPNLETSVREEYLCLHWDSNLGSHYID